MSSSGTVVRRDNTSAGQADADSTALRQQEWKVLAIAVFGLLFVFVDYILLVMRQTEGHLILTTDDFYIGMAVAKNLAQHGTWGIQPDQFTSLISGPAWVLLMALVFKFVPPAAWIPLAMNMFFAVVLFVLVWSVFRAFRVRPAVALLGLFSILVLTPIVPVSFTGLEHILQCCVDLGYVIGVGLFLGGDAPPARRRPALYALVLLSPIVTLVRYEGAFIIAVAGCLLLARKRYATAVITGVLGAMPIIISGIIFVRKGWFFFPTTLIQKANYPHSGNVLEYLLSLLRGVYVNLHVSYTARTNGTHLAVLIGLVLLLFVFRRESVFASRLGVMTVLFTGTALLHLVFAHLGWFYRYEAYLMCMGLVLVVLLAAQLPVASLLETSGQYRWPAGVFLVASILFIIEPILDRACIAHCETPLAARNIWEQPYQLGQFLQKYYPGASVAASDIGAVNFFGHIHCFDLVGLGTASVTRQIASGHYDTADIRRLTRAESVQIAMTFESLFNICGGLPPEWIKVGDWTISDNLYCGGPTVSFFAVDPAQAPALRAHLVEFAQSLPKSVMVNVYN